MSRLVEIGQVENVIKGHAQQHVYLFYCYISSPLISEGMAHCLNNVHLSKFTQGYVPSICHLVKGGGGGSKPPRSKGAG